MYEVTENGMLKTIESWMLFVPAKDNDGKRFSPAVIDEILQEILLSFPGFTVTSTVGYWKEKGETYEDENYEIVRNRKECKMGRNSWWLQLPKGKYLRLCRDGDL